MVDEVLLRTLTPSVISILVRRGADFAAAEDAVQDALVEAVRVWPGDPPRNPKGWLVTVAWRKFLDAARADASRRRREEFIEDLLREHETEVRRCLERGAARVQLKIDSEFPRFTEGLLSVVYPHYLAPTPSMAVVKMEPNHRQGVLTDGFRDTTHVVLAWSRVTGWAYRKGTLIVAAAAVSPLIKAVVSG